MKAYKGFNKDMTCRGFQYEEGKEYTTDTASLCNNGFHACENPLDCFSYYAPGESVYHEVEIDDNGERHKEDTKVVGKRIKVGAELSVANICKLHFEYVKARTTNEHTDIDKASAGDSGSASAGAFGSASAGDSGSASAGYRGSAVSGGKSSVGNSGIALARGNDCLIKGGIGSILLIAKEESNSYDIKDWKAAIVDGEKIKADTWYKLENGEFVEVEDD
jgi:hypothetical protein